MIPAVVDALGPPEILVNAAGSMFTRGEGRGRTARRHRADAGSQPARTVPARAGSISAHARRRTRFNREHLVHQRAGRHTRNSAGVLRGQQGRPVRAHRRARGAVGAALDPGEHRGTRASSAARSPDRSTTASGQRNICAATLRYPKRVRHKTSSARCCGWRAMPGATSPVRPSSSTAAGPHASKYRNPCEGLK